MMNMIDNLISMIKHDANNNWLSILISMAFLRIRALNSDMIPQKYFYGEILVELTYLRSKPSNKHL